jgi:hypothetical protein
MSDVFRCDYCGLFRSWNHAHVAYVFDYETRHSCEASGCNGYCADVVDDVYTASITCSPHCAEMSFGAARVGGR